MPSVFAFNQDFQRRIVKLALEDDAFCTAALKYVTPEMFESDTLMWCWRQIQAEREQGRTATMVVLRDKVRKLEQVIQGRYHAALTQIEGDMLREEMYIREQLAEFIRRNLFVAGFNESTRIYNTGRADEAIDLMRRQVDAISQVTFSEPDRGWFFEELQDRQRKRSVLAERDWEHTFPTGIVGVDQVLDGGLSRGELGCWMADSKGGKSLLLCHLTAYAVQANGRRVLLALFEGSRLQTENRIETIFARCLYSQVKRGLSLQQVKELQERYRAMKGLLVVRAFTNRWDYNADDIRSEMDELYSVFGWRPEMMVADYGDLMRGRGKGIRSEEEHQRLAFSDLKSMTTQDRGYAIWTATQARRPQTPKEKEKQKKSQNYAFGKPYLQARDVADSYNKIRRSDFIGSINQDRAEKAQGIARLHCDMYRDNMSDRTIMIKQCLERMVFVDVLDPLNRPDSPEALAEAHRKKAEKQAAGEKQQAEF